MKKLTFELTEQEANLVLQALGQMPYAQVFQIVHKFQEQAQKQMSQGDNNG